MSESNFTPGQLLVLVPKLEHGYGAFPCDIRGNVNDLEEVVEIAPRQPIMFIRQLVGLGSRYDSRDFSLVLIGDRYGILHESYLQPLFSTLQEGEVT